jgi:hypothetical protein
MVFARLLIDGQHLASGRHKPLWSDTLDVAQ